jgi:hypothetical protein
MLAMQSGTCAPSDLRARQAAAGSRKNSAPLSTFTASRTSDAGRDPTASADLESAACGEGRFHSRCWRSLRRCQSARTNTMREPYRKRRELLEDLELAGPHWSFPPSFSDGEALAAGRVDQTAELAPRDDAEPLNCHDCSSASLGLAQLLARGTRIRR